MIRKSAIATTTLLLLLLAVPLTWAQERAIRPLETNNRQALVIGNANYAHAGVLRNPANDAKAIGRTLEQLGFKVTTLTDADERQMDEAIRNFGRQLRGSNGVELFTTLTMGCRLMAKTTCCRQISIPVTNLM